MRFGDPLEPLSTRNKDPKFWKCYKDDQALISKQKSKQKQRENSLVLIFKILNVIQLGLDTISFAYVWCKC